VSSGKEGEGPNQVPKVPTFPKCKKSFDNKINIRCHLIRVYRLNKESDELKKLMSEMAVYTRSE
jgi:hypothetical protein